MNAGQRQTTKAQVIYDLMLLYLLSKKVMPQLKIADQLSALLRRKSGTIRESNQHSGEGKAHYA